jgi:hypothetical protein
VVSLFGGEYLCVVDITLLLFDHCDSADAAFGSD